MSWSHLQQSSYSVISSMISTGLDTIDLNLVFNSVDLLHGQTGRERRVPVGQQEGLHPVLHALPF